MVPMDKNCGSSSFWIGNQDDDDDVVVVADVDILPPRTLYKRFIVKCLIVLGLSFCAWPFPPRGIFKIAFKDGLVYADDDVNDGAEL